MQIGFIENLKQKPDSTKKLYAIVFSGVIALIVAGISIYGLYGNILKASDSDLNSSSGIKEESNWQKFISILGDAKKEFSDTTNSLKGVLSNFSGDEDALSATSTPIASSTDKGIDGN